jgi:hypothetical protein
MAPTYLIGHTDATVELLVNSLTECALSYVFTSPHRRHRATTMRLTSSSLMFQAALLEVVGIRCMFLFLLLYQIFLYAGYRHSAMFRGGQRQ